VPEYIHKSVMVAEVLEALQPRAAAAMWMARWRGRTRGSDPAGQQPGRVLYGCDADQAALEAAVRRLAPYAGRFELRQINFSQLEDWLGRNSGDGVLLDWESARRNWTDRSVGSVFSRKVRWTCAWTSGRT